ncbi:hypothetical protein NMD57_13770 [Escherichia coli]
MNQPMTFMWNNETAEMAKKAGATGGISETGAYEGEIVSAVYTFGKDGSQSQALELSLDSNGLKANFLRINFLGKDGQQTFGMGLVSALMWVAQVKQAQPQQVQGQNGIEWHCPALVGKRWACSSRRCCTPKTTAATPTSSKCATFSSRERVRPTPNTLRTPQQKRSPRLKCR